MLKYITDQVPEGLNDYYEPQDTGGFRLKVEGVVPAADIEGLKKKNGELISKTKTMSDELTKFKTIFGEEGIASTDKFHERLNSEVEKRVQDMRTNYEGKLKEWEGNYTKVSSHLENIVLSDAVKSAAMQANVAPTALDDVVTRARGFFQVKDGQLIAKEGVLDKEGKPYNAQTWVGALQEQAPHLFQKSQGAGVVRTGVRPGAVANDSATPLDKISANMSLLKTNRR